MVSYESQLPQLWKKNTGFVLSFAMEDDFPSTESSKDIFLDLKKKVQPKYYPLGN